MIMPSSQFKIEEIETWYKSSKLALFPENNFSLISYVALFLCKYGGLVQTNL